MIRTRSILFSFGLLVLAASCVSAASISFSVQSLTGSTPDTVVLNDGVLAAINLVSSSDSTVNGVTFKAGGASASGNITENGITIAYAADNTNFPSTSGYSPALEQLMETEARSDGNNTAWPITISGLTNGTSYRVQLLGDTSDGSSRTNKVVSGADESDVYTLGSGGGVSVIASFVADSGSIVFDSTPVGFQRSSIGGVAVAAIPEPTSVALLILAGAMVLGARRN